MTPFEDLIHGLGSEMGIDLEPDTHQSCLLAFPADNLSIQIDLDTNGDHLLIGSQLGTVPPGPYRERIFFQAMRVNGGSLEPRGTLAFSEKNNSLVLFQFLPIFSLDEKKLHTFIQIFREHATIWKESLERGEVPTIEEDVRRPGNSMFGLQP